MKSSGNTLMTASLDLRVKGPPITVSMEDIRRCKTLSQAIAKCADLTGSTDKAIAANTGVDAATWSKIKQGEAGVKGEFLDRLMHACGNELPLLWLNYNRGWDPTAMRRLESDLERENRELRERLQQMEFKHETIVEFMQSTRIAA